MRCLNCGEKVGWRTQICPACRHLVVHDCARRRLLLIVLGGVLLLAAGVAVGIFVF